MAENLNKISHSAIGYSNISIKMIYKFLLIDK